MKGKRLHHHIRLNSNARADIAWWHEFCQHGMAEHNLLNNPQMQWTWNYTQMLLAYMDVVRTFKGSGFTMTGNHISSFQKMCLSNGNNSLQLPLQPSLGSKSASIRLYCDNLMIVNLWEGKSSKHPRVMSLLRMLFLTVAKNNFAVSFKHLLGKTNELADALSRKQFICLFHLAPQAQ